ncbi:MAG: hypothetical protein P8J91_01580 [Pirellulaceae bacterium]|nr:hypothetical protein [Pirellulaceae bacterium]
MKASQISSSTSLQVDFKNRLFGGRARTAADSVIDRVQQNACYNS